MKIAYASDLHLEFNPSITLTGLSGADGLVLAGDVDTMPEYYTEFLRKLRLAYAGPVIFVLGNHEYYHGVFPDDRQAFLLENEAMILDGVRFLGATLWTDFASGKQMRSCQRMMSDFEVIHDGHSGSITPEAILKVHQDSIAWLDGQFTHHPLPGCNPHDGPTVVITHHAPSVQCLLSHLPRMLYAPPAPRDHLDAAYANRWERLLGPAVALWVYGHTHAAFDQVIRGTRVVSNPRGYDEESTGFDAGKVIVLAGNASIASDA